MVSRPVAIFQTVLIGLLLVAGISACQLQQQGIIQHEDNLSAAGFVVRLANTAERQAMLHRLPANQFVRRESGGGTLFVYADPVDCSCLYVGNQQAFDQYVSKKLNFYGQEQLAAQAYHDDAWGPPSVPFMDQGLVGNSPTAESLLNIAENIDELNTNF